MITRFSERRIFRSSIHIHLGGSRSRSIDERSGSLEFHLDPNSKKLVPATPKGKERLPEFIVKPRRQYINEGEPAKFKASFEGSPDTELTWIVNGKLVTSDGRHKLYKENDCYMLEIPQTELADQGTYTCKIENTAGSATFETELEVFVRPDKAQGKTSKFLAPSVDMGLEDTEFVDREKDATLVCRFYNAVDAKASWYKDNKELSQWQATASFDGTTAKLVTREASYRACGVYECVVRNSGGEAKTRCLVSLLDKSVKPIPPKFTQALIDQMIEAGEKLVLEAEVTGKPRPKLTWYKDKMELTSSDDIRIDYKDGRGRLIVDNLGQTDSLKFSCVAKNIAGEETSLAKVAVTGSEEEREPPIFTRELHDMEVSDGDRVELSVEVRGSPPIDIVWVHNNREIPATDPVCRMVNEGSVHKLILPEVFPEDSGEYVCEAYNDYGDTDTFCRLTVNEEFVTYPDKVFVNTGSSAILKCRISGEPSPYVDWSKGTTAIQNGHKHKIFCIDDEHILEVLHCNQEDSGHYTCTLSNIAGTVHASCGVFVAPDSSSKDFRSLLKKRSPGPGLETRTIESTDAKPLNSECSSLIKPERFKYLNGSSKQSSSPNLTTQQKGGIGQIDYRGVLKKTTSSPKTYENTNSVNSTLSDSNSDSKRLLKDSEVLKECVKDKSELSPSFTSNQLRSPLRKLNTKELVLSSSESKIPSNSTDVIPKPSKLQHKLEESSSLFKKHVLGHTDLNCSKQLKDKDSNVINKSATDLSRKRQIFENCESKVKDLPPKSVSRAKTYLATNNRNKVNQVLHHFESPTRETGFQPDKKVSLQDRRENGSHLSLSITDRIHRLKSPEKMDSNRPERKFTKTHSLESPKYESHDRFVSRGKSVELPQMSTLRDNCSSVTNQTEGGKSENQSERNKIVNQSGGDTIVSDLKPEFQTQLQDQIVNYGSEMILECGLNEVPVSEVSWEFNNKTMKQSKSIQMSYGDRTARLVVTAVSSEDEGVYKCLAKNVSGTSSTSCKVSIQNDKNKTPENSESEDLEEPFSPTATPPKIYNISPSSFCILRGGTIQFKAFYTSVPAGKVMWSKNKQTITSGDRMYTDTGDHCSTLTITNIDHTDSGRFNICVENKLGKDMSSASLTVEDVPEAPVGEPWVSEVTLTSVVLSWYGPAYDGGCPITNYRIEACDAEEQEWTCITNSCLSTTLKIENLSPLTPYFFRIFAENKHGISLPCQTSEVTVTKERRPSMASRLNSIESDDVFTQETNDVCTPMFEYGIVSPLSPGPQTDENSNEDIDEIPFEHREVKLQNGRNFEQFYDCKEEIGKGKFGYVYKCVEKSTGQSWAAKILKCRESEKKKIELEVEIMNQLKHPKILMLWDVFEAPRKIILVMELIGGGELFERVLDDDFELTERDCIQFMRQILDAVDYMHGRNVLHLDLKPENILCIKNESNKIKIIDFGLARFYKPGENVRVLFGTPEFIAPEVVNYDEIGFTTDMWSIGVVCYVLLTGLSPFMGDTDAETLANVTQGDFDFDDESFDNVSDDGKHFIEQLLVKNKRKRMKSKEALEHRWLAEDAARLKTSKINTKNLKRFMARRKWQKTGNAIRALGRMTSLQKFTRPSPNNTSSANKSVAESPVSSSSSTLTIGSQGTVTEDKPPPTSFKVSDAEDHGVTKGQPGDDTNINGHVLANTFSNSVGITKPVKDINSNVDSVNPTNENSAFREFKTSPIGEVKTLSNQNSAKESYVNSANSQDKLKANNETLRKNDEYENKNYRCPEFAKEMVDSKAFPGDNVRFDVAYLDKDSDISLTWYFEEEVVHEDPRHYIQENTHGNCSLIIKDVCEDDDGEYSCKIENEYGEDTCSAELIVYGA